MENGNKSSNQMERMKASLEGKREIKVESLITIVTDGDNVSFEVPKGYTISRLDSPSLRNVSKSEKGLTPEKIIFTREDSYGSSNHVYFIFRVRNVAPDGKTERDNKKSFVFQYMIENWAVGSDAQIKLLECKQEKKYVEYAGVSATNN